MNIKFERVKNSKILTKEDINISIIDEHNDQELTNIGQAGKSFGIMTSANYPHLTISSNKPKYKKKLNMFQYIISIIFPHIQISKKLAIMIQY